MTKSLGALFLFAFFFTACGSSDDETPKLGNAPTHRVPGCEAIDHRPCDIRAVRCQDRLMELAACLRGSEPLPVPPVTTMTEAQFAAYLNAGFADDPVPDPNPYEVALTLLDLVQPGALRPEARVASDVEHIWGVYRDEEKDIVIVDHGVDMDQPEPNVVLVHEFVHALQDSDVDLRGFYDEYVVSYDSYLAASSVVEGEARLHETRFWSSLLGLDPGKIDWDEHFQSVVELAEEAMLMAPSPYLAALGSFPYEFGARFVNHAWADSGPTGVDGLFASPPTRAVAVMNSVTSVESADWPAPEFTELEPPAPWTLDTETSLGAWGLYLYLSRLGVLAAPTQAGDLLGDRLGVYVASGTTDETAVVWQLEFASELIATQVETHARQAFASVLRDGARLVIARTTGASTLDWALVP